MRSKGWKSLLALLFALIFSYGAIRFATGFNRGAGVTGPVEIRTDPGLRTERGKTSGAEGGQSEPAQQELAILWEAEMGSPYFLSSAGSLLVAASNRGEVIALDASRGKLLWRYNAGGWITSSPACAGGRVFLGSSNGLIHALDQGSGLLVWSFDVGGEVLSTPVISGDRLYSAVDKGMTSAVYCLEVESGRKIWTHDSRGWMASPPTCGIRSLHFGTYDQEAVALNIVTGKHAWAKNTGRVVFAAPVVEGDVVYYVSIDGKVQAFKAEDGTQLWERELHELVWQAPLATKEALLLVTYERSVYALEKRTGEVLWRLGLGQPVEQPLLAGETAVYAFTSTGDIYGLGVDEKRVLGVWKLAEAPWTPPLLAGARFYVSSRDGYLRAYAEPNQVGMVKPSGKE